MTLIAGILAALLVTFPATGGAGIDDAADTLLAFEQQSTHARATGGSARRALVRYEWIDAPARDDLGSGSLCNATGGHDLSAAGVVRLLQAFDRASGLPIGEPDRRCVAIGPVPPAPPSPPTAGDVWDRASLPAPPVHVTPPNRGVTGFETHLWTAAPGVVPVDASLPPYGVHAVARPVAYSFAWGDGASSASLAPGDQQHPAARHVYERTGTYRITVTTVWAAEATFRGPGIASRPVDIGRAVTSTTASYPVDEIRAVLVAP